MTDYTEQCAVCQSAEDVSIRPLMTGNIETKVCALCYMAWYETGITSSTELLKYRTRHLPEQEES